MSKKSKGGSGGSGGKSKEKVDPDLGELGVLQNLTELMALIESQGPEAALAEMEKNSSKDPVHGPIIAAALETLNKHEQGAGKGKGGGKKSKGKAAGGEETMTVQRGKGNNIEAITREVVTDEKGALEILRALHPMEGVDVVLQKVEGSSSNGGEDDEWLDAEGEEEEGEDDGEDGKNMEVHEEDLVQVNSMIGKLAPLSLGTLEELSKQWAICFPAQGDHLLYQANITERIRYLAAMMIVGVADRFQCLHNSAIHNSTKEMMLLVNNLVFSLWHGIGLLSEAVRKNIAVIFDLDPAATANDICVTVTGLGIATFFRSLPICLLETVCNELKIMPKDKEKVDIDIIHEHLTHQICSYFYPTLSSRKDMNLRCTTQLTVHENGPGSFTCTIDNSWMMGLLTRDLFTSNQFNCAKVKWRAQVAIHNGCLTFIVNQRSKSFNVKMTIRNSEAKKKGKNKAMLAEGQNATGKNGMLFLEATMLSTPKNHIGFENILTVQDMFESPTTSPTGMKLYNKAEDRVTFQFTLEPTPTTEEGGEEGQKDEQSTKKKEKEAKSQKEKQQGQTIADLIAQEEEEKKEKANQKARQKWEKKKTTMEAEEAKGRDKIAASYSGAHSQISDEFNRSYNRAAAKVREREKKEFAAKLQPSPELQQEVAEKQHEVQLKRSAMSKLNQEKTQLNKQVSKLMEKLEARRAELDALKEAFEKNAEELEEVDANIVKAKEAKVEQEEEAARRAEARQRLKFQEETAPAPTAAIKDFSSFWTPSQEENASSPFLAPSLLGGEEFTPKSPANSLASPSQLGASSGGAAPPLFGGANFGGSQSSPLVAESAATAAPQQRREGSSSSFSITSMPAPSNLSQPLPRESPQQGSGMFNGLQQLNNSPPMAMGHTPNSTGSATGGGGSTSFAAFTVESSSAPPPPPPMNPYSQQLGGNMNGGGGGNGMRVGAADFQPLHQQQQLHHQQQHQQGGNPYQQQQQHYQGRGGRGGGYRGGGGRGRGGNNNANNGGWF